MRNGKRSKSTGDQYDDRVVEVHWDKPAECWRMIRFRDDKPHGNHKSVVQKIIESIRDGVEKEALLDKSMPIRNAWKIRHGQPPTANTAPTPSHAAPPPPPQAAQHTAPPHIASVETEIRYGPIAVSKWSKVSGPDVWAGMYR